MRLIDANKVEIGFDELCQSPYFKSDVNAKHGAETLMDLCVRSDSHKPNTIDPETLPIVQELRDQIEDVSDTINAYNLIGKSMYFPKIKAIGMVDEVIANSDGISLFVNSGGGSFYVDFNDVQDLIKEREENAVD